jgi:hypothetical protein
VALLLGISMGFPWRALFAVSPVKELLSSPVQQRMLHPEDPGPWTAGGEPGSGCLRPPLFIAQWLHRVWKQHKYIKKPL